MCVQEDVFVTKYMNDGDYVGDGADCEENANTA